MTALKDILKGKGLKITPQRLVVLDAVMHMGNHPTAEEIIRYVRRKQPSIATGTVYKILETLVESRLLVKVKTEKDSMRYDSILESHHHLYGLISDRIEDYFDPDLDQILHQYFSRKQIPGFAIKEIRLQLCGEFVKEGNGGIDI